MASTASSPLQTDVACPFCGLCCDDLKVGVARERLKVVANGCELSKKGFETPIDDGRPKIGAKAVSLEVAAERAAAILKESALPVFDGLATDMEGAKAVMQMAAFAGGVVEHADSQALFRNFEVIQNSGWMTTTIGEVRNRADMIILAGTDGSAFPRFFERCVWGEKALFKPAPAEREVIYVGAGLDTRAGRSPDGRAPTVIASDRRRLAETFGTLRALYHRRPLTAKRVAGVSVSELKGLVGRIQGARYGVIVWDAGEILEPHGALAVQAMSEFIKDINETIRFSGFPLGGNNNALGASQVCTWQYGFPLRTSFSSGYPVHDPYILSGRRLIESGEADALMWISAFDADLVPPGNARALPTIVLGAPGMKFARRPEVYIPVGVPGIDHAGHYVRTDGMVSLPLRRLRASPLPTTAAAVAAIEAKMREDKRSFAC